MDTSFFHVDSEDSHASIQKVFSEGVQLWQCFLVFFYLMRGSKYHYKRPSCARQRSGIQMAFHWRADNSRLSSYWFFQGIRTSIAKWPYTFAIFQGKSAHFFFLLLAGGLLPNIECWLGSYVIFQDIRTNIAKKPYTFLIFQGGGGGVQTLCPPLDRRMTLIRLSWCPG